MTRLARAFFDAPVAHRGLHDETRPENSLAAFRAAADAGYGIECDLHLSADGVAMVFHDHTLDRMTEAAGLTHARTAADLAALTLAGASETIPSLARMLDLVAGRVPLLIEIKDPTEGPGVGPLEAAVAMALATYPGPAAVMSFQPASVAWFRDHQPGTPRGLVSRRRDPAPGLGRLSDAAALDVDFISHDARDLPNADCAALRRTGVAVFTWTVRDADEAARLAPHVDNITFESYLP